MPDRILKANTLDEEELDRLYDLDKADVSIDVSGGILYHVLKGDKWYRMGRLEYVGVRIPKPREAN